jgi:hypothetical protein
MITKEARSVSAFLDSVLDIAENWEILYNTEPYIWYRGDRNGSNSLLPGSYWRIDYSENDPWIDFRQGAPSYLAKEPRDEWEWYFLAQHYGLPTRLLDWTESPIAALYFALHDWDGQTNPVVWVLEPAEFNRLSVGFQYVAASAMDNLSALWLPSKLDMKGNEWKCPTTGEMFHNHNPLAIYPRRANPRIAAQRGAFTVHGIYRKSIVDIVNENPHGHSNPEGVLAQIKLVEMNPDAARKQLMSLGIRHSNLFPELEHFVAEIKEFHKCK